MRMGMHLCMLRIMKYDFHDCWVGASWRDVMACF